MPVLPVAPGELTTGKDTLRSSSISLPALRASWSAPPPGPHGTMNSIGRDGYFSCAGATLASAANSSAARACEGRLIEWAMGIVLLLEFRVVDRQLLGAPRSHPLRQFTP